MNFKCIYGFHFKFLIVLFWIFIANTICFQVNSQTFSTKTFNTENGLTYNYIQNITQDKTGFLWIATWDGINRYDGYEFRNYYHRPNDSTTFPFFPVDKILVDSLNEIWVLCALRPLYRYNKANDNFEKFNLLKNPSFSDIDIDHKGDIWLINNEELFQYFTSEKQIKSVKMIGSDDNKPFKFNNIPQIVFDNHKNLWIFDYSPPGFNIYNSTFLNDSTIKIHRLNPLLLSGYISFPLKHFRGNFKIYTTDLNETWLFSKFGLFLLDTVKREFIPKDAMPNPGEFKSKPFFSWIDEKSGIHSFNTKTGRLFTLPNPPELFFETMFIDKNSNIWAGTISESRTNIGLYRFNEIPENLNHYLTKPNENGDINLVFPILKDKYENIWVGTRTSNYLYKIKQDNSVENIEFLNDYSGKNHPKVRSMVQDSNGIWLGCTDNYILYYDFETEKFSVLNDCPIIVNGATSPLNIHNMVKRDNSLIFCGWEGVYSFSLKTREIRVEYSIGAKGTIYSMSADANKGLWLGAQDNTIIYLDSCFNQSGVYKIGDGRNLVEHICFGNNNDLWIALMGGGLGHFEPETGKTEIFTTADGLPNNTLYSILKDKRGNLWISTNKGLSLFNPQTRIFSNFGKSEGLHIEEFNSDAFFKSPDDELFFGGVGGMVSFYPDSMYNRSNVYSTGKIVITDFKVSGFDRLFQKAVYELDTFLLQKGDNNIQLTFACLDFLNGEKIKYRYRMEEEDDNWVETNYRHRNVNYSNLLPGTYHFEVQCTNPNGEWTMSKKLLVQIPFFYYQTQWFRAMVVLIVLSLMLFTVGLVVRQIRLQANQKQNELKLESLRGQMNPHFIFNALNSVNYFISNNDKVSANSYIADFSRLIRSVLNNLSYDFIPLETELESVNDYLRLEHLRFSDKFNFETEIEINNVSQISVFPGLVQPFIENAIWHGVRGLEDRKGLIKVTFKPENSNMIRCIVEDDGIGRKQAEVYKNILPGRKSQGIRIVEERLKIISDIKKTLYNVVIDDINPGEQETGTRVVIDLPIQTNSVN